MTAAAVGEGRSGVFVDTDVVVYAAGDGDLAERCRSILAAIAADRDRVGL